MRQDAIIGPVMECNLLRYFAETHFFSGFAVETEDPTSEKQV